MGREGGERRLVESLFIDKGGTGGGCSTTTSVTVLTSALMDTGLPTPVTMCMHVLAC